ncbi:MAG: methionyl-tRNA formyltransferase [Bacteriovoracia bacterium]
MKKLRTIFFGTPDFAVATLEMLAHHPLIEIVAVVSMPDRPAGRGQDLKSPEVVRFAQSQKIPVIQTENINREDATLANWEASKVDVMVVLAFAQFLGSRVLAIPALGCFNIHTSLLPKYRGAAPIQYALWNGDTSTGVSIQKMVKKMDAGDIVHSHPVSIAPNETGGQLTTRLKFQAALACNDFIEKLSRGSLVASPQDETLVTFAPTLKKEDGFLDFANQTVAQIHNRVRAMDPWPGTYCFLESKRLKVLAIDKTLANVRSGNLENHQNTLVVGCLDGAIRLSLVQLEGKKASSDIELLNGWRGNLTLTPPAKESK